MTAGTQYRAVDIVERGKIIQNRREWGRGKTPGTVRVRSKRQQSEGQKTNQRQVTQEAREGFRELWQMPCRGFR